MNDARREAILRIINDEVIKNQEQLVDRLSQEGFLVTQATVSRDMRTLGIRKETVGSISKYVVHDQYKDVPERFYRVLKEGFIKSDVAMNILVIKTVSGMAMAVAAALDAYQFPEIVGCIAGDDTIMCAIRDMESAKGLQRKLHHLLKD